MGIARLVAVIVVFGASAAHACVTHDLNDFKTLPGLWLLGPMSAAAIYLLAAIIERPFVTMAGVAEGAMAHSLVTSFFNMVTIGVAGAFVIQPLGELALVWGLLAIAVSPSLRYLWLVRRGSRWRRTTKFGPLLLGSIVSAVVVLLLPALQVAFGFDSRSHALRVQPYQLPIFLLTLAAGMAALAYASNVIAKEPRVDDADGRQRGFEVMPTATPTAMPTPASPLTSSASGT